MIFHSECVVCGAWTTSDVWDENAGKFVPCCRSHIPDDDLRGEF